MKLNKRWRSSKILADINAKAAEVLNTPVMILKTFSVINTKKKLTAF